MKYLCLDIWMEILSGLSVKDLIRLKSVSKAFLDLISGLISNDHFVRLHLNKSSFRAIHINRHPYLYLKQYGEVESSLRATPICRQTYLTCHKKHRGKEVGKMSCVTSYGSCNGLVCVLPKRSNKKYGGGGVVLWNPALHEAEIFDIERPEQSIYNGWFGYDNGEYKLVLGTNSHLYLIRLNVDTGTWKSSLKINKNYDYYEPIATLVHGTLHWPASYIASHEPIIIAYDLRNETVGRIATPNGMTECQHYSLGQVDGCLSTMFVRDYDAELWVMKEYGVKESWTKLMILSVDIMFAHCHFAEEPYDVELDDPAQLCSPIYGKDFYVESLISPQSMKAPRVD